MNCIFIIYELYIKGICIVYELYRVSQTNGIDKKFLFRAVQGFNSQFLNLIGVSISASFVWCII